MARYLPVAMVLLFSVSAGSAIDPNSVYLVVNAANPASREIAEYYCKARNVPIANIVSLKLPLTEEMTRAEYDSQLRDPLKAALLPHQANVKVILTIYGVPLRVAAEEMTAAEKAEYATILAQQQAVEKLLNAARAESPPDAKKIDPLAKQFNDLGTKMNLLSHSLSKAAVDSELMLLWYPKYQLDRWQANILHDQFPAAKKAGLPPMAMTCRLDGPTMSIVKRMIDDAVATEKIGLTGNVFVDARGIAFDKANPSENGGYGYGAYDTSMREMAALLKSGGMNVTLDDKDPVFPPNAGTNCSLYCGWYSHGKFVDSFTFARGAVAWHLASSEAITLRDPKSTVWCPNLLRKGVCATVGPVAEPFTIGFPKPAEFFGHLATGKFTLVECYCKSVVFSSWMMTLVGDPLYTPFKANPAIKVDDVKPSPVNGQYLFR